MLIHKGVMYTSNMTKTFAQNLPMMIYWNTNKMQKE